MSNNTQLTESLDASAFGPVGSARRPVIQNPAESFTAEMQKFYEREAEKQGMTVELFKLIPARVLDELYDW